MRDEDLSYDLYCVTEQSVQATCQGAGRHDGGGEHQRRGGGQRDQQTQEKTRHLECCLVRGGEVRDGGLTSNFIITHTGHCGE